MFAAEFAGGAFATSLAGDSGAYTPYGAGLDTYRAGLDTVWSRLDTAAASSGLAAALGVATATNHLSFVQWLEFGVDVQA